MRVERRRALTLLADDRGEGVASRFGSPCVEGGEQVDDRRHGHRAAAFGRLDDGNRALADPAVERRLAHAEQPRGGRSPDGRTDESLQARAHGGKVVVLGASTLRAPKTHKILHELLAINHGGGRREILRKLGIFLNTRWIGEGRIAALASLWAHVPSEPKIGEPLPNAQRAVIPKAKLYEYALHPTHSAGGPKARLWRAVFGVTRGAWAEVRDQLLEGIRFAPVSDIRPGPVCTYEVIVLFHGANGQIGPVITGWKLINDVPRLVTAFPRV